MLYLASTSPRRHQLLTDAGLAFAVVPPGPEPDGEGRPVELARGRARSKAAGAIVDGPDGWVLGVDTVVEAGGAEYGKPRDRDDARRMLEQLAGSTHEVHTALCLRGHPAADGAGVLEEVATAVVRCREIPGAELDAYLGTDAWRGKAGGYGIQDAAGAFMSVVEGDFDTVVGLSLSALQRLLGRAEEART